MLDIDRNRLIIEDFCNNSSMPESFQVELDNEEYDLANCTAKNYIYLLSTQIIRNAKAKNILSLVSKRNSQPYSLYIRPFIFDIYPHYIRLQRFIAANLGINHLLICLSSRMFTIGAARVIMNDAEWKKAFEDLAFNAVAIFFAGPQYDPNRPFDNLNDGFTWEMNSLIKNNLLGRAVYLEHYDFNECIRQKSMSDIEGFKEIHDKYGEKAIEIILGKYRMYYNFNLRIIYNSQQSVLNIGNLLLIVDHFNEFRYFNPPICSDGELFRWKMQVNGRIRDNPKLGQHEYFYLYQSGIPITDDLALKNHEAAPKQNWDYRNDIVCKIKITENGELYLNNKITSFDAFDDLRKALDDLKNRNGVVWYFRENDKKLPSFDLKMTIKVVLDEVIKRNLPVKLSETDFK
jgi:hypothetical protein